MNILLVSMAFPPKRDAESLQVARIFSALARTPGAQVDVVTSALPTLAMATDEGLRRYAQGYRQLVEVDFFENRYVNFAAFKLWPAAMHRPDSRFDFPRRWKTVARTLQARPDVIYSRAFPLSSAIMGHRLACHYGVPWVMHLSDPWTISPLHSIAPARRWNEEAEASCFDRADAITFTSRKTVDAYAQRYPQHAAKLSVSPNVYEQEAVQANAWRRGTRLRFVYTGSLIASRSPAPVIAALAQLERQRPDVRRDIEVVFAGMADRPNAALLADNTVGIRYLGEVPLQAALKVQRQADVLLLIDSSFGNPADAMFFPSKLLDYIVAGRRTIAVTDQDSTTWDIVGRLGLGDRVTHADVQGLCDAFVRSWEAWKREDGAWFERTPGASELEAGFQAGRLMELFRSVMAAGPRGAAAGGSEGTFRSSAWPATADAGKGPLA